MFTVTQSGKITPVQPVTVLSKIPINFRDSRVILEVGSTMYAREYKEDDNGEKAHGYFIVDMSKTRHSGLSPIVSIDNEPVIMSAGSYAGMGLFRRNLSILEPTV